VPPRRPRKKFGASQKDRIFFAVLPDAEAAARIHALAEGIKAENDLGGNLILPEHLHITLFHLGDWRELPTAIVEIASRAAAEVSAAPFAVTCRRVESFRNRTGIYPFVLLAEQGATPLHAFQKALGAALKKNGLGGATQGDFKPHVTLLRHDTRMKPIAVEPLTWTVRDFVLIHSLLGQTRHVHLGRWRLNG
jgi:2'-5' RNA ligase